MVRNGWWLFLADRRRPFVRTSWELYIIPESVIRLSSVAFLETLPPNVFQWLGNLCHPEEKQTCSQDTQPTDNNVYRVVPTQLLTQTAVQISHLLEKIRVVGKKYSLHLCWCKPFPTPNSGVTKRQKRERGRRTLPAISISRDASFHASGQASTPVWDKCCIGAICLELAVPGFNFSLTTWALRAIVPPHGTVLCSPSREGSTVSLNNVRVA